MVIVGLFQLSSESSNRQCQSTEGSTSHGVHVITAFLPRL